MSRAVAIATTLLVLAWLLAGCDREPPRVVDPAGVFTESEKERLTRFHDLLLSDYAIDYRIVTVQASPDINIFAMQRYSELEVGAMSVSGHGLLLVIDPLTQRVRMEVGYGLEGHFPDAFVAYIENRQMLPFFAADRVADGVLATTELIVDRAQRYRLGETAFEATAPAGSGGGGATARVGDQPQPETKSGRGTVAAGRTPADTLATYLDAMARRDADPELPIYSPGTREMLRGWVMTAAQMDNVVATYRSCQPQPARFDATGMLAVIRYGIEERRCAPWFFQRHHDAWLLDLTMMSRAIRFGRDNSWHFDPAVEHPYEFAFDDWQLDRQGFPR